MLGLFTNSISMTIIRPTCCSECGAAVSEIRIGCEDTLNLIRPRNVIEFEGLGASDPELKLKIDNLDVFVGWIEETGARDLHRFEGPCDFAMAAMFSALNALIAASFNASSAELVRVCLAEIAKLGTGVTAKLRKSGRDAICPRGPGSVELVGCVRYEAAANWSWAIASNR